MSEANADRGEHELVLAGVPYLLRPSFTAITAMEKKVGKSLVVLANMGGRGELTLEQLGQITATLIRAGAGDDDMIRNVTPDRIAELIYEEGMPSVGARVTLCLIDAATGGRTASGEAKAGPDLTTDPGSGE